MKRIFLSAGIPLPGRGNFLDNSDLFLIQFAVRELFSVCLGRRQVVWGGHPAITPMVWSVCEDLGVDYAKSVLLYQSSFFAEHFPDENRHFANVVYVDAAPNAGDEVAQREASLLKMRSAMLAGEFEAGVFIGGMEGIFAEHSLFTSMHPTAKIVALAAPGGAAGELAGQLGQTEDRIDFARLFHEQLGIAPTEPRNQV